MNFWQDSVLERAHGLAEAALTTAYSETTLAHIAATAVAMK